MATQTLLVNLPNGTQLAFPDLSITLGDVLQRCSRELNDPKVSAANFGALDHCFFTKGRTLIDDPMALTLPLSGDHLGPAGRGT